MECSNVSLGNTNIDCGQKLNEVKLKEIHDNIHLNPYYIEYLHKKNLLKIHKDGNY